MFLKRLYKGSATWSSVDLKCSLGYYTNKRIKGKEEKQLIT